jgi:general L-amino acid transport system substrate-binding protein
MLLLTGNHALADTPTDGVQSRGILKCGVVTEPQDWNKSDLHGNLSPLGADICRAVAIALLGQTDKLDIQSYNTEQDALVGLKKGQSDIVAGISPSAITGSRYGLRFSLPFFQDGQGFMVHRAEGIHSIAEITGHKLCYIEDTDNDPIVLAYLAKNGVRPVPFGFQEEGEMDAAIMDRHCQVTSAFISKLAEARSIVHVVSDYVFLPDMLTLVPATVAVDARNSRLAEIVNYTISVLLEAEFLGVTRANAAAVGAGQDPRMARLLGIDFATALGLGLPHDWSRKVIAGVGNYGEVFNRTIGPHTTLNLDRGVNALWNKGGLMAPLPLQ